jgi:hypothetical protein
VVWPSAGRTTYPEGMRSTSADLGRRLLALAVLLVAAWLLLKVVIGVVTAVAWTVVAILGVIAVIWAVSVLTR